MDCLMDGHVGMKTVVSGETASLRNPLAQPTAYKTILPYDISAYKTMYALDWIIRRTSWHMNHTSHQSRYCACICVQVGNRKCPAAERMAWREGGG